MEERSPAKALLEGKEAWEQFTAKHPLSPIVITDADLSAVQHWEDGPVFPHGVTFDNCTFARWPFIHTAVGAGIDFIRCTFNGDGAAGVDVALRHLHAPADELRFVTCRFLRPVTFNPIAGILVVHDSTFKHGVRLASPFGQPISFAKSTIEGSLDASGVTFFNQASFTDLTLMARGPENFQAPTLKMAGAVFKKTVSFQDTKVQGVARFDDATFHDRTDFKGVKFSKPPVFSGAKLNAATMFDRPDEIRGQFPDVTSADARENYRTLKAHMANMHAVGEQLAFYWLEMKAEQARHEGPSLSRVYEWTADYGLSWLRPLAWLLGSVILFAALFSLFAKYPLLDIWSDIAIFSLHNAFPFLATFKNFVLEWDGLFISPPIVAGLALGQNILSSIFLFLILLGVRNKLRMK